MKVKRIIVWNNENFVPGKSWNGGCYAYGTHYTEVEEGVWEVSHTTSSEFNYCHVRGEFQRCSDCWDYDHESGQCGAKYETISTAELKKVIREAESNPDYAIEYITDD